METTWLLKGPHEAAGWKALEQDSRSEKIEVLLFDRDAWALVKAPEAPTQYEGLVPTSPPDGLYLDNQARSVYLVGGHTVRGPHEVLAALGAAGKEMMDKYGDADLALQYLGRVY